MDFNSCQSLDFNVTRRTICERYELCSSSLTYTENVSEIVEPYYKSLCRTSITYTPNILLMKANVIDTISTTLEGVTISRGRYFDFDEIITPNIDLI